MIARCPFLRHSSSKHQPSLRSPGVLHPHSWWSIGTQSTARASGGHLVPVPKTVQSSVRPWARQRAQSVGTGEGARAWDMLTFAQPSARRVHLLKDENCTNDPITQDVAAKTHLSWDSDPRPSQSKPTTREIEFGVHQKPTPFQSSRGILMKCIAQPLVLREQRLDTRMGLCGLWSRLRVSTPGRGRRRRRDRRLG